MDLSERFDRRTLTWILAGAAALRIVWALFVPVMPISDSHAYDMFARTLAEHGVFGWRADEPFAFWPPGTSFLHGLMYWAFGVHYEAIVALNIALSIGIIAISARVAERFFGARIGLATAVLMSVWPTLMIYPTIIASELPYLFFSIAALDVWTAQRGGVIVRALTAGMLLGVAALIRPLALLLPAVYAGALVLQQGLSRAAWTRQFQMGVLAVVAMTTVIAPWTWRNYELYGEPVLISTNGGITLWMGNTPGTNGGYMPVPDDLASLSDSEQNRILGARARQYILDEPGTFVVRSLGKLVKLYTNESIGVVWNEDGIKQALGGWMVTPLKRTAQVTWALIVLFAAVGMVALAKRHGIAYVLYSPPVVSIAYYSFVYSVTVSQDRYHLSFASQIGILAAAGLLTLQSVRGQRSVRALQPS